VNERVNDELENKAREEGFLAGVQAAAQAMNATNHFETISRAHAAALILALLPPVRKK
jgi:hypothetical protein